ncbi:tRNA (adenine(58)-N(1))-methyltransferase non-catalytic subunit TRM6-like [Penaeus japonicus]|uniref:tRNA (adenine(58)-N(1))-methyltransferase non-catalytic subunit TRM6-like n=1 Tax=Penaeus japonicus TaxID=27405 RepID=UPI001C715E4E|nr:tRNA (adenine(58)-N(1))-methyltransferase non-catalytic subunit TRM6-like [Penaeus japonicus]
MPDRRKDIYEGTVVVVQKGSYMKTCRVLQGRSIVFGKKGEGQFTLNLDGALGCAFGSSFKMERISNKLFKIIQIKENTNMQDIVKESGEDNRNICDDGRSQKLSPEEISQLKDSGLTGKEVIQTLTENSTTFKSKTKFSQEKYVNKKQRKYDEVITMQRPSLRLLSNMYYIQDPLKIANLRIDTLSQILCFANVQSGGRFAVFESGSQGLVTAGMLHRMGMAGKLVQIYQGNHPQREAVDLMNFTEQELQVLSFINFSKLPDVDEKSLKNGKEAQTKDATKNETSTETTEKTADEGKVDIKESNGESEKMCVDEEVKEVPAEVPKEGAAPESENKSTFKRPRKFVRTQVEDVEVSSSVLCGQIDGLVIACRQHPVNITKELLQFLKPGHPFVVFSPYKEPLMDLFIEVKAQGATNLRLSETWLRHYQVLPMRTHPEINMSGGGGYILCGARVMSQ